MATSSFSKKIILKDDNVVKNLLKSLQNKESEKSRDTKDTLKKIENATELLKYL